MSEADFARFRRRIGALSQRELLRLARRLGWEVDPRRGKGSHVMIRRGRARTFIPTKPKPGTQRRILDYLESQEEE